LSNHIRIAIIGDDETQPHLPACPLANTGSIDSRCNYLLTEGEIKQIVKIAVDTEVLSSSGGNAIIHGAQRLYLSKGHRDNNCIRCVGCSGDEDNSFWFQIEGILSKLFAVPAQSAEQSFEQNAEEPQVTMLVNVMK
jgi:hypothetical protein